MTQRVRVQISHITPIFAIIAQLVERIFGIDEVIGAAPINSSNFKGSTPLQSSKGNSMVLTEKELHEKRCEDLNKGKKTLNQIRREMGLPPVDGGDVSLKIMEKYISK